jgi:LytS/YehU family sensor histidine kinase
MNFSGRPTLDELRAHDFIISPQYITRTTLFILITLAALGIRMIAQWRQAEQEKTKAELAYLKAQINPHFLFNTLNAIYVMALKKSDKTADGIVKLSNMMRFVIDETPEDFVPLVKKIEYINNYIELQKMRLNKNMRLMYQIEGRTEGKRIAPMTLMPFIENAFKHGVTTEQKFDIFILITINENSLNLYVENSIFHRVKGAQPTQLGLNNTIQRLELLYPAKYNLDIKNEITKFIVDLTIDIS